MPDSHETAAERLVQPKFRKSHIFFGLVLASSIVLFRYGLTRIPDRQTVGERAVAVRFEPVHFDPRGFLPLRLAGAWRVRVDDPRFGGISGLAVDGGELLAITDSGVLVRLPKPDSGSTTARLRELPAGPGDPRFKRGRDSEAIVADPGGRGWWVAFENGHELWLFDRDFRRPLDRVRLGGKRWPRNRGIEGLAADGSDLLLVPESGGSLVRVREDRVWEQTIAGSSTPVSEVASLPGGRIFLLERGPTLFGFANSLALLERDRGYRLGRRIRLGLGPLDNAEALAVEPRPGGGHRLWLMTDDNFQPVMRTLLIVLDAPP